MKISAKGRYALAAMIYLADIYDLNDYTKLISISDNLGISKIYLEQIFSLLKKSDIVNSTKGAQGGYQLSCSPDKITAYDILFSTETSLFEKNEPKLNDKTLNIDKTLESIIYEPLDSGIESYLKKITLDKLLKETKTYNQNNYIFYI